MPKLWSETIDAHRRTVHDAILETTWALVAEHGLMSVTMSQIAKQVGIGRATLYKYFSDVEAILAAQHDRHVTGHLEHLSQLRYQDGSIDMRLRTVLEHYALIRYHRERHGTDELAALLHKAEHVDEAQQQLANLFAELLAEAASANEIRDDVTPDELASYCLHALAAASTLRSEAAVHRLVTVTLAGLRPPR